MYWRRLRTDPAYRRHQNDLRNERRRRDGRDRSKEGARKSRAQPVLDIPPKHCGHLLFDAARRVVGPRSGSLTTLEDPLYDDLLSVATLAIIEGANVREAVDTYRSAEIRWGRFTAPLLEP